MGQRQVSARLVLCAVWLLCAASCATVVEDAPPYTAFAESSRHYPWVDLPSHVTQLILTLTPDSPPLDETWTSLREVVVIFDVSFDAPTFTLEQVRLFFDSLTLLPSLQSLIIHGLPYPSSQLVPAFEPLKNCRQLSRLEFTTWFYDTDAAAMGRYFQAMPALTDLSLEVGTSGGTAVAPGLIRELGKCTGLRSLRLRLGQGTGEELVPLAALKELRVLHLTGSVATDFFVSAPTLKLLLGSMPMLRTLVLNDISGQGLAGDLAVNAPNLEDITVRGLSFDDGGGWHWLSRLKKLRRVHLEVMMLDTTLLSDLLQAPLDSLTVGALRHRLPSTRDQDRERSYIKFTGSLLPASRFAGPAALAIIDGFRVEPAFVERLASAERLTELSIRETASGSDLGLSIDKLQKTRPSLSIRR